MKKLKIFGFIISMLLFVVNQAWSNCSNDPIVQKWILERNTAEKHVIQAWAKGKPEESYLSDIALIISNELYLCSFCRNNETFLHNHLHVISTESDPQIEHVPGIILERIVGYPVLSVPRQYKRSK